MGQWGSSGMLWGGGIAEAVYPAYHLILGGVGLVLAPGGYERRLQQAYAAKLSTSQLSQSDRLVDQLVLLDNWNGGEGFLRHETDTPDRYRRGAGIDQFTEEGAVGLGPYMSAISGVTSLALNEITALIPYQGYLMIGFSNGKVYSLTGSTVALAYDTTKAGGIRSFMIYEQNLYTGTGSDGVVYRQVGLPINSGWLSNFTVGARSPATVTGVYAMSTHCQEGVFYGWHSGDQTTWGGLVGQIANSGGTTVATNEFQTFNLRVSILIPYRGNLMAVSYDATEKHWVLYEGDDSEPIQWQFKARIDGGYCRSAAVLDDKLYLGDAVQGRIWRWNGSSLDLIHQLGSDLSPYTSEIKGLAAWRGGLWAGIVDTDGTMALLRYDGNQSWSRPVTGLLGTTPGPVCVYNDQLYYATTAAGAARLYRTDGTFGGSGNVESSLINADLSGTGKLLRGVTVNHSALVSPQTVELQYKLEDTGSWVSLGTSSTGGSSRAAFDFPSAITADLFALKLILTGTAGSSSSLKVYSVSLRYYPAPGAKKEWSLTVELAGTTEKKLTLADDTTETRTGEEISAEIWGLVEDVAPVNLIDLDREEYTVQIAEFREDIGTRWPNIEPLDRGWNLKGSLRLVEV